MNHFRQLYEQLSDEKKDEVFDLFYKIMKMRSSELLTRIHPNPQLTAIAKLFWEEIQVSIMEYNMIRFILANTGETISLDPKHVSTVVQDFATTGGTKSLLSGTAQAKQVAVISMENGDKFIVDDPNGTATSQIESGKRTS